MSAAPLPTLGAPTAEGRPTIDVRALPPFGFGHRSILWWATLLLIMIETMTLALVVASYFYLRGRESARPPGITGPPWLGWGTLNLLILLGSVVPNHIYKKKAEAMDLAGVRLWLPVALAFGVAFVVVRWFEFGALNCDWNVNAYGSVVYTLLGLHTVHLVTDVLDSAVLAALLFIGPIEGKRFVDTAENAYYWDFVVAIWIPIYLTIYWAPRWL